MIITLIKEVGIILGAIPTMILYGATFWLARTLCKKCDEHKENDAVEQIAPVDTTKTVITNDCLIEDINRMTECMSCGYRSENIFNTCPECGKSVKRFVYLSDSSTVANDKICFCRKCGEKLIDNSEFCQKCGTKIIKGEE